MCKFLKCASNGFDVCSGRSDEPGVWLQIKTPPGSSTHQIWQAVRASSAAPYYLDDFKCGNDRSVRTLCWQ